MASMLSFSMWAMGGVTDTLRQHLEGSSFLSQTSPRMKMSLKYQFMRIIHFFFFLEKKDCSRKRDCLLIQPASGCLLLQ
jgi:hypothetical protein